MEYTTLGILALMIGSGGMWLYFGYLRDPKQSGQYKSFASVVLWASIMLIITGILSIVNA